jgi:hypothetical protein
MARRVSLLVAAVAALLSLSACDPHVQQCQDGTQARSVNRGACSGHGGVAGGK